MVRPNDITDESSAPEQVLPLADKIFDIDAADEFWLIVFLMAEGSNLPYQLRAAGLRPMKWSSLKYSF